MAAVVRGGASRAGKPRPKGPAAYANTAPRARVTQKAKSPKASKPRAGAYNPGKLNATARVGLPPQVATIGASVVVAIGLIAAAVTGDRPQRLADGVQGGFGQFMAVFGFKLDRVHIQGAADMAKADILRASGLYKHQPVLDMDLNEVRARVERVGWVKQAKVVRLLPDTVVLAITPRPTLAVWQEGGVLRVIDDEGRVIREADPGRFPQLPLVVGAGANEAAGVIMPILRTRPQLMERTEALVRVDGRRWDLRMKDGSLIQLPAVGEDSALIQLDQLNQRSRVLELGFERIDLRDAETIAVRPRHQTAYIAPAPVAGG
jgi:cell division protein FtsQ